MPKRTPIGQSSAHLGLHDQLPVNPQSTTSRVLLDNPLLRVVNFSFDAGQQLTEHSSPRAVVVELLEGRMRFTVEGEPHLMNAGDVIYLAPGARHALDAETACRMSLVMIDMDLVEETDDE
ncbi:cupin domain-containing protein [Mobilicoccus caccae]|uniref:Cupin type-2 domain-containing protein n=1 Tax=Mobilicoccus caccae TaxID=1859295 RepID=A0ABQ6ISD0_9MICO|nr:cupin domain-containing protein [Mobilicoccus caccae]GMA40260.1 hypothetical protein GCM10025883_23050 [Mobilicoccus caccae]